MPTPFRTPGALRYPGRYYGVLDLRGDASEAWLEQRDARAAAMSRAGLIVPVGASGELDTQWEVHDDNNDGTVTVRARGTDAAAPHAAFVDTDGTIVVWDPDPADEVDVGAPGGHWKTLVVRRAWVTHGRGELTLSTHSATVSGSGTLFTRMAAADEFAGTGLLNKPTRIRILTGANAGTYTVASITSDTVLELSAEAAADQTVAPDEWEEVASYLTGITPPDDAAFQRLVPEFELVTRTDSPDPGDYMLADVKRQAVPITKTLIVDRRAENRFRPAPAPVEEFASLHGAAHVLQEGDTGCVNETWSGRPGSMYGAIQSASGEDGYALDVSGVSVVLATWDGSTARCKAYSRDISAEDVQATYTLDPNDAVPYRVATDGVYVVVIVGTTVMCFDHDDGGDALWSYDHGGDLHDVCIGLGQVYVVGAAGTGGHHVRAIELSSGTVDASYTHGGEPFSCCTDGHRLYVGGDAGTSSATLRCLVAATLTDAGTDTTGTAWNSTSAEPCTIVGQLATDGERLFQAVGIMRLVDVFDAFGSVVQSYDLPSGIHSADYVAVDRDYVYVSCSSSGTSAVNIPHVVALDTETLAPIWRWNLGRANSDANVPASDGAAVYVPIGRVDVGQEAAVQLVRLNHPRPARRVDPLSTYGGQRQRVVF